MHICTDSRITLSGPVTANVTADLQPRQKLHPLEQWVVAGQATAAAPKIALVEVDGLLVNANQIGPYSAGENPLDLFRQRLDAAAADPQIRALVLRINTPGGGVGATDIMDSELQRFRARTGKPVVAYLMETSAGGGYYLATGCDLIIAQPAAVVGGIGVLLNLYNLRDTMAQLNVFSQPIRAGEHIDMGSSIRELTPQERQWLQQMADEFHKRFIGVVLGRRKAVAADEPTNFDGRVFTAAEAQRRGLVDRLGYMDDAIAAATALADGRAGAAHTDVLQRWQVVMFRRPDDPARSPYAMTPNTPLQGRWLPVSVPGLERSRLPTFLYMWQIEPTLERAGGQ
jgi:protease-4